MAPADAANDLKALIQSRHPVITIDTVEEERVDNLLQTVASDLHMPLFTWTVTHGLQRVGGEGPVYATANPQMLVRHLATLTIRAVFHLKNLHAHLADATVARGVRDIALRRSLICGCSWRRAKGSREPRSNMARGRFVPA